MKLAMAQLKNEGGIEQNLVRSIAAIHEAAVPNVYLKENGMFLDKCLNICYHKDAKNYFTEVSTYL